VQAPSPQAVSLQLADGRSVVWGGAGARRPRPPRVLALLGRPARVFDVSGEGLSVVR
jgi:hypothetical protein